MGWDWLKNKLVNTLKTKYKVFPLVLGFFGRWSKNITNRQNIRLWTIQRKGIKERSVITTCVQVSNHWITLKGLLKLLYANTCLYVTDIILSTAGWLTYCLKLQKERLSLFYSVECFVVLCFWCFFSLWWRHTVPKLTTDGHPKLLINIYLNKINI